MKRMESVESSAPATPAGQSTKHYTPPSSVLRGLSQLAIASPQVPEVIEESQVEEETPQIFHGPVQLMHQRTLNLEDTLMDTQEVQQPGTGGFENKTETTKVPEPVPPVAPDPVAPSGSPQEAAKAAPQANVETKQTPKANPTGGSVKDSKKDMYHDGTYWKKLICTYVLTSIHCTSKYSFFSRSDRTLKLSYGCACINIKFTFMHVCVISYLGYLRMRAYATPNKRGICKASESVIGMFKTDEGRCLVC